MKVVAKHCMIHSDTIGGKKLELQFAYRYQHISVAIDDHQKISSHFTLVFQVSPLHWINFLSHFLVIITNAVPLAKLTFGNSFLTMLSHTFRRRALSCSIVKCFFLDPGGGVSWENLAKTLVWWWWRRGDSSEERSSSRLLFFFTFFNLPAWKQWSWSLFFLSLYLGTSTFSQTCVLSKLS